MMTDTKCFAPVRALLAMLPGNGGVDRHRLPMLAGLLARYMFTEPFRQLEVRRYQHAIETHELSAPPIFILGFWRSGTTHLQRLLREDPRFESSTVFRSVFSDIFLTTEAWFKPILQGISRLLRLPLSIQRMPMDFDLPAEADVGLCASFSAHSYTWGHVFPRRFEAWIDRMVVHPSREDARAVMDHYDRFLRKLSYRSGGKRLLIKTPGDTGRVRLLLARYPEARFVYIHRDPFEVFHSNLYLWRVILREVSLQALAPEELEAVIVRSYRALIGSYLEARDEIPESQLTEIRFEDLRRDPIATLEGVYGALDLGSFPREQIATFVSGLPRYDQPRYETSPALRARLSRAWDFSFDTWTQTSESNA